MDIINKKDFQLNTDNISSSLFAQQNIFGIESDATSEKEKTHESDVSFSSSSTKQELFYTETSAYNSLTKEQVDDIRSYFHQQMKCAIIVAGCRDYCDMIRIAYKMTEFLNILSEYTTKDNIRIVEGEARGVDSCARNIAEMLSIQVRKFPADWNKYHKRAGFLRNTQMAQFASKHNGWLIAFWDGKSHGTKHMISQAKLYEMNVIVVRIDR